MNEPELSLSLKKRASFQYRSLTEGLKNDFIVVRKETEANSMDTDGLILVLLGALVLIADGWLYLFSEKIVTHLVVSELKFGNFQLLIAGIAAFLIVLGLIILFRKEKKDKD